MKQYLAKGTIIAGIIVAMLIPIHMVKTLVTERAERQVKVYDDLASKWGSSAVICGVVTQNNSVLSIPEQQRIDCDINAEMRQKGIFKVPFYTAKITVSVNLDNRAAAAAASGNTRIGVAMNYKGAATVESISFGDMKYPIEYTSVFKSGILWIGNFRPTNTVTGKSDGTPCKVTFTIKGIDRLDFQQISARTEINAVSNWTDPSFSGAYIPDSRAISSDGFKATWKLMNPMYVNNPKDIVYSDDESFGIGLFVPVSIYTQTDRTIKYAILFLILTFTAFFLFETLNSLRIHPLQYLMIGAALTLFFLLLLSISEHLDYSVAYLFASIATISIIMMYCTHIMKNRKRLIITGALLGGEYLFLFILLQLEQYSLFFGSMGLFVILGSIMYFTRKIDWYNAIQMPKKNIGNDRTQKCDSSVSKNVMRNNNQE
ncbi:MAG TPA: cell envelope integrity protein CreD [Spirochaetota bacterium]|nr:cell envelope integrity protein CreD [Spirochaetota bacterium]